jgi:hypothetical protein
VYVALGDGQSARVEGIGEAGGRRGFVVADLAASEVMVGEIATGPSRGEPIRALSQVHVGPVTAREVHWE